MPVSLQNNVVTFGPGTLVLSGAVTNNGNGSNITVSSGTLQFGNGTSANGTFDGDLIVNSTANGLVFANATAQTYGGGLSGNRRPGQERRRHPYPGGSPPPAMPRAAPPPSTPARSS